MESGHPHIRQTCQPGYGICQHTVLITVSETAAFGFHQFFLRTEGGDIAVHPKPHAKSMGRVELAQFFHPGKFIRGIQIHIAAGDQDCLEDLPVLDRTVVNNLPAMIAKAVRQVIFLGGDYFRVEAFLSEIGEEPGQGVGLERVTHNEIAPVLCKRIPKKIDVIKQFFFLDPVKRIACRCVVHV